MRVELRIRRFNPERDPGPRWIRYEVEASPFDRVLDLLRRVREEYDGTLAFRSSCGHGMCGSDAMLINGRNRLACQTLVRDLGGRITVAPLPAFRVIKDLVVDMEPFFSQYRSVMPYLVNPEPPPARERLQTPAERARYEDTTKCILCAACTSSCPIFWGNGAFVGPAAVVAAHRFLFDSRDRATDARLARLDRLWGVWSCRTIQNCTQACPRGIDVARAILEVKHLALRRRLSRHREVARGGTC